MRRMSGTIKRCESATVSPHEEQQDQTEDQRDDGTAGVKAGRTSARLENTGVVKDHFSCARLMFRQRHCQFGIGGANIRPGCA